MNFVKNASLPLKWSDVENSMPTFTPSTGGFTNATRGFVTLPSGEVVFVKIGIDDSTKQWANKEILIYGALAMRGFEHMPNLLSVNADSTGFALENLSAKDGWEWETEWSKRRLDKTLKAMDDLASLDVAVIPRHLLDVSMINEQKNPWAGFTNNKVACAALQSKLEKANRYDLVENIILSDFLKGEFNFHFVKDCLVHNDVRRDNCAWNQHTEQVKLIDWNWLQLGDRRIDTNALLVNAHKAGLNLADGFSARLDKNALSWLAGYWFNASVQSFDGNISENATLRDYQLESAICAYDLMLKL